MLDADQRRRDARRVHTGMAEAVDVPRRVGVRTWLHRLAVNVVLAPRKRVGIERRSLISDRRAPRRYLE